MLFDFFKKKEPCDDRKNRPDCPSDEELSLYLLNKTNPEEMARVDQHVKGCERCRENLKELKMVADSEF